MKPHRKDGYRHRTKLIARVDEENVQRLDELAAALSLSRAYCLDLLLGITMNEGSEWLAGAIQRRASEVLNRKRKREASNDVAR